VKVEQVEVQSIQVGKRQRRLMGDVSKLATSIEEVGLLQPIGLTSDYRLIYGARRRAAFQKLGRSEIAAQVAESPLEEADLIAQELAENMARLDLSQEERDQSIIFAVELTLARNKAQAESGKASQETQSSGKRGPSPVATSRRTVARQLGIPESTIREVFKRQRERDDERTNGNGKQVAKAREDKEEAKRRGAEKIESDRQEKADAEMQRAYEMVDQQDEILDGVYDRQSSRTKAATELASRPLAQRGAALRYMQENGVKLGAYDSYRRKAEGESKARADTFEAIKGRSADPDEGQRKQAEKAQPVNAGQAKSDLTNGVLAAIEQLNGALSMLDEPYGMDAALAYLAESDYERPTIVELLEQFSVALADAAAQLEAYEAKVSELKTKLEA
jgi:ParB-like chromosome segregation protein Spo0J